MSSGQEKCGRPSESGESGGYHPGMALMRKQEVGHAQIRGMAGGDRIRALWAGPVR